MLDRNVFSRPVVTSAPASSTCEVVEQHRSAGTTTKKRNSSSYDDQLRAWARAIIADQTPVKGGFAPAPAFPNVPTLNNGGHDE